MLAGGLAQMTSNNFASNGLGMPTGGLASRRGGQNIKPLSFDTMKQGSTQQDNGAPTPRTARGHLLAGLRTAPKTSTGTSFGPMSPTTANPQQQYARNNNSNSIGGVENMYNPPKTAFPQYQTQQQQQQGGNNYNQSNSHQYTVDQVLAPEILDEQAQEYMDPNLYEQLLRTNMYLAQQQQQLQQQLRSVQAAAQQFQQLNLNNPQLTQQQIALYQQQQQLQNMQQQINMQAAMSQGQQVYYNQATGQYFVDTSSMRQPTMQMEQPMSPGIHAFGQQQQHQAAPRVQVSPPPSENQPQQSQSGFRSNSPPKQRYEVSQADVAPLPPPSANAFRRGHKKASSLAPVDSGLAATTNVGDAPKSAGPKTANFPMTPMTGTYGPGQARAGEHPVRQPRNPPSLDEIKAKPTSKYEGSKNFVTRTRRSAVSNLMRAGNLRRKGTSSSAGSMSPVSETAEESSTPITDNESDSGRSGSGSLAGEMDCGNPPMSASGTWGAIGSERPGSRSKNSRGSVDSNTSDTETSSFANVFKNSALRNAKEAEEAAAQRKAPRLVLTSVEKRKTNLAIFTGGYRAQFD